MKHFKVTDLFRVDSGDYHAVSELDPGVVPLVSCGDTNNGIVGFYDIPAEKTNKGAITVAYNGSWPLLAKYHPYAFGTKDDVAILIPRRPMRSSTLLYFAACLNRMTWRYSYGRKCYREKLEHVQLPAPFLTTEGQDQVDEDAIAQMFPGEIQAYLPTSRVQRQTSSHTASERSWRLFGITSLMDIDRGDFHSLSALDPGPYMTVSRVSMDNGAVGYYDLPSGAKVYPKGRLTVSTVSGDTFVQLRDFIATDNVLVCKPKRSYQVKTLFFLAFALNRQKWRYGYGRQCYIAKFSETQVYMPVTADGDIDEDYIATVVENTPYWSEIAPLFATVSVEATQ